MSKNMMKNVGKRSLAMLLVMLMLAAFVPQTALAAEVTSGSGTWVSGKLTYSYVVESDGSSSNGATGSVSVSGSTLTVKAVSSKFVSGSGCGASDTNAYPTTTTVTVTNESSYPLKINSLSANGATVAGASAGDTIVSGATFMIIITANPNSDSDTSSRTATGTVSISVTEERTATITAVSSPYVSYTLNGHQVAQGGSDVSFTADIGTTIELPSITAPEGYTFKGWRVGSNSISMASSFKVNGSCSVYPVILKGNVVEADYFKVGNDYYSYWEDAMGAAANGSNKKVIVNLNVTLPDSLDANLMTASGGTYVKPGANGGVEYIVPAGVTLVVPFDEAGTTYTNTPAVVYGSHTNPTAFRTLTMPNKTSITVQNGGAICCSGKLSSSGQMGGWNGTPTGPDGRINMQGGSKITLNSGANLYCWGYIYGAGQVEAQSGSTVYEAFQIKDWRGGTATSNVYKYAFIFNQYYVQNIEVPLTMYKGATEKLYSSVNASSSAYPISATFIGSGGMFTISSGYIVKDYIESTDRLHVGVYGNISMSSMTISGIPVIGSISTSDYILPVTSNIGVDIHSGTTSITQTMELLPGVEINIDKGATMQIDSGKKVYVYDNDDWGNFSGTTRMYPIGYSVANGTTAVRNASSLTDAKINVNGTLTVAGSLFTSNGGANITSSEGTEDNNGKIVFSTAPTASSTIYEMENNSTKTSVTFYAPHFYNGDETYSDSTGTGASTWYYDKDGEHWYRYTVDFVYNDKTVARDYFCENGQTLSYDASWLTNLGATLTSGSANVAVSGTNVNVSNVTVDSVVTLSGTAATFIPTFVLNEHQYANYQLFTGNTLTETRTINGETWYVVKKADSAMTVGAEFAAPTDAEMGVTANAHNGVVWNLSGVSAASGNAYGGFVPVGEPAGGEAYIFGFYTGAVAYNSATDAYYSTLAEAMEDIPAGGTATITMLADCGSFEEESRTAGFSIVSGTTVTIDLNGHTAWGRLINSGDLTLELNGGTWDYHTGATAAAAAYQGAAAISNTGNLTVRDTVGGGRITADAISNSAGANGSAVIRNNAGATLTVTGVTLSQLQNVNSNNYGIFNQGTINALTDVDISTKTSGTTGYNIYNTNNGKILLISGGHQYNYSGYSIFNYGGQITTIDGLQIDGRYGINNRNMRGSNTIANGYNIACYGEIGTIQNVEIVVGQHAIYNGGKITTLSNSTFTAHPDSAQVDTRGNGSTASEGNVQCYTVFNSANWWYDTNVWKQVDNGLVRTYTYKDDLEYRPTIGSITNCNINAEITSTSADHGYALYNAGVIESIGGSTSINAYRHPNNAKISTGNYALLNTGGGVINSIGIGVTISATNRAVQNSGAFTTQLVRTYSGTADKPTTPGGQTLAEEYTYSAPSRIGSISGATLSATSTYALYNAGSIGNITGTAFSANYNVLYNATETNTVYSWYKIFADGANKKTANTDYQRVYTYTRNMSQSGVIGTISGGSITATGAGYQAIYNVGYIDALRDLTISTPTGKATASGNYYPLIFNSDSRVAGCDYTYTTEYNGTDAYVTLYEWEYVYGGAENPATINLIDNVNVTNPQDYSIRNLGYIDTIQNSNITAGTSNTIVSEGGPYVTRLAYRYYSGTTPFSTTKNVGEVTYDYTRVQPYIGTITNNSITAGKTTYAIRNAGHIGTITNNTISSVTTDTIYNMGSVITEFHSNVNTLRGVTAVGATSLTNNYDTTENAKVEHYTYAAPLIDRIGEGNVITGTYYGIRNQGKITAIDSGEGTPSQIITNGAGSAVYNYTGIVDTRERTATLTATNANASYTDAVTYLPAEIGTIKHTNIRSARNVLVNGSGDANYNPVKIGEIGEGAEFIANGAYDVVSNNVNYAQIAQISGGIYTVATGNVCAYKNNNTNPEYATLISGGDFKGAAATRANAIFEPDNTNRQTYPEGYTLSTGTESVTFHDGSTGEEYFYITKLVEVSFETDGGSEVEAQTVEQGQKLTKPEDPTKEGFTFAGWYKEESCENAWDFENDTVTEAMTLYAKWTEGTGFTVKFFMEDGETQIGENQTVSSGGTATAPADPTKDATADYTYSFAGWKLRGADDSTATMTLPAITADTDFVAVFTASAQQYTLQGWSWTGSDANGYTAATATFKAAVGDFTKQVSATVSSVTTAATCDSAGSTVYTATVAKADSPSGETVSDSKTVTIPATGHDYELTGWSWTGYTAATATFTCKNDSSHVESATATITKVRTEATCEADGSVVYTATVTFSGQTYTDSKTEVLPATGHDWEAPTYEWAADNSSVTAKRVCKNDASHVETETVNTTSAVTKAATCEAKGETTYTATFTNAAFATQTKTLENIDALGHDWNAPTYEWAADNSSVTAKRVCKNDASHVETETVNTASAVTKAATCEAKGETTYTATFTNAAFATQTKTVENIDALGHDWNAPTYEWAADNSSVTAKRVCKNDTSHVETETVNTTSAVTKAATCEAKGETTYTATFTDAAFATQTKTLENIDALGHDWDEPTWSWTGTTAVTATFTCKNDSSHVKTVSAQVTSEQGSGEDYGYTIHTATVTLDGKTYTDIQKSINQYTVIFKDEDGTVLSTVQYDYGTPAASIARPEAPIKAATAQYTFTFAGWTPEIADVTADATYTATYTSVTNKYKVTFVDSDSTVLKAATEYEYGTPAAEIQQPEAPTKESTAQFSYSFAGWTPELQEVTADVTYTATYKETLRTYTVFWYNESGETLLEQDDSVSYGETPRFNGEEPAKAATAEFSYSFTGWKNIETGEEYAKNALPAVQGDVRYSAVFTEERNQYTIRFFDGDQLLQSTELPYGETPAYNGEPPAKQADAQYTYSFLGWKVKGSQGNMPLDPLPIVTGSVDYEAVYSWTVNEYTITWIIDGTTETTTVPYGETPAHADPVKTATAQYSYRFTGWEPAIVPVTGDATYTAVFEAELRSYDIVFVDEDGTVLNAQTLTYGSTPVYGGETPVKEADAQYTYTFAGWTPAIAEVTGPATYTATYSTETNLYTVTWNDYDGTTLETDVDVPYGTMPSFDSAEPTRAADAQYTYSFAGWTPKIASVTGNVTYTATYSKTVNKYTVTFVDEDGSVLKEATEYEYGTAAADIAKPTDPVKAPDAQYTYTFAGWNPVLADVTANVIYTATYTATVNTYTVTWLPEGGGDALEIDYGVPYGTTPVFDGTVPEKASTAEFDYSFCGWSDGTTVYAPDALPVITGDVSFTAVYTGVKRFYTVTWLNGDGTTLKEIKDIPYGDDLPSYSGDTPTKQATVEFEYVFMEWTTEDVSNIGTRTYTEDEVTVTVETVLGNITYTPVFDSQVRSYTVEFRNEDGSVLRSGSQLYGSAIVYGETPEKAQDERYTYRFLGWTLNGGTEILTTLPTVSGEMIFTAAYEPVERTFTVTWLGEDGTVLETDTNVPYGATPSFDSAEPTKAQDEQHSYTFAGWEPEIGPVTKDVTYTARFDAALRSFTVRFDPCGGTTETETLAVLYGASIGELPVPTREGGWVFMGWYTTPAATAFDICHGTEVTADTVIEGDTTVYAHWRLPGDVNGDGKVNTADVTLLAKYVKARGRGVEIVEAAGNVDGSEDGKITTADVALLAKYVKARGNGVVIH